jgi:hypothetical protein
MVHYVCLKDWDNLPEYEDIVAFALDESFRERRDLGLGFSFDKRTREPNFLMIRWPKFKDNPSLPLYVNTSVVNIVFSPFNIPHSKIIRKRGRAIGYPKICQVHTSGRVAPALVDHRIFYRTVYSFAKETNGVIFERPNSRHVDAEVYYSKHKKIIEYPFRLKLGNKDIVRVPSNTF